MLKNFVEIVQQEVDHCVYENIDRDVDGELSYVFRYIFRGVKVKGLLLGKDIVVNENQKFMFEKYGLQPSGIQETDIFIKAGQFTRLVRMYLYESGTYPVPDKYVETNTYSITCKLGVRARGNGRPTSKRDFFFVKLRESLDFLKTCRKNYRYEELRGLTEQASMTNHFMRRHKAGTGNMGDRHRPDLLPETANYFAGHSLRSPVGGFPFPRSNLPPSALISVNGNILDGDNVVFDASASGVSMPGGLDHTLESSSNHFFKRQKLTSDLPDTDNIAAAADNAMSESFSMLVDELGYLRDRVFQLENLLLDLKRLDQPEPLTDEETTGFRDLYEHPLTHPLLAAPAEPNSALGDPHRQPLIPVGPKPPVFPPHAGDFPPFIAPPAAPRASLPPLTVQPLFPPPADDIRQMIGDGSQLVNLTKEELMGLVRLMSRTSSGPPTSVVGPIPSHSPVPAHVPAHVPVPVPQHIPSVVSMPVKPSGGMNVPSTLHGLPGSYPRAGATEEEPNEEEEDELGPRDEAVMFEPAQHQFEPSRVMKTIMPMTHPLMADTLREETVMPAGRRKDRVPRKRRTKTELERLRAQEQEQLNAANGPGQVDAGHAGPATR